MSKKIQYAKLISRL